MKRSSNNTFKTWKSPSVTPIILLASISIAMISHMQTKEIEESHSFSEFRKESSLEQSKKLKQQLLILKDSPSFGFRNLIADGLFLNFLQYFGDEQAEIATENDLSSEFFDAIIAFEPFYRDYYLFLAGSTTLYAGEPDKTIELMNQGLSQMDVENAPDDAFYIWRYKAVEELLFLGDSQAAQRSFENAADWAASSERADSELMEELSRQTSEFLKKDPDSLLAQIAAWNSIVASALNEDIRERASQRVQELTTALQNQSAAQEQSTAEEQDSASDISQN